MRNRIVMLVLSAAVIASLVLVGCAPEVAPPAPPAPPPEEEEEAPPAVPEAEVIEWRMTTPAPAGNPWHYLHQYLCDSVYDMSGGTLEITLYPINELFPGMEDYDNLSKGAVEMTASCIDWSAGINPAYQGVTYWTGNPFGNDMSWELIHKYKTEHDDLVEEMVNRDNIYYLGGYSIPAETFQSTIPLTSIEDYEGLKVRTAGLSEKLHKKLGCSVTRISSAEIYTAVQLGTIDAFEMGGYAMNWASGFHEIAPYILEPVFHTPGGGMQYLVNMDAWNRLTPELKAMLKCAADASCMNFYMETKKADMEARGKFLDYGCEINTLPPEDYAEVYKKAEEVWEEFAAQSEDCARLYEIYKEMLRLYGYEIE